MDEPYLGEIRLMSFVFAPKGWALCNGQLLPINQNQALFSLLGTTYGGNGQTTFALPDLRGRVPMHVGAGHDQGEVAGAESVVITQSTMPMHTHAASASSASATVSAPAGQVLAAVADGYVDAGAGSVTTLKPETVWTVGGSQAHENRQPFLVVSYCIALAGVFPSRN